MKRFSMLAFILIIAAAAPSGAGADSGKSNSTLRFLKLMKELEIERAAPPKGMPPALEGDLVTVTVKFDHVLSASEISSREADGMRFYRIDGDIARTGSIYPARVPWGGIGRLEGLAEVLRIESGWRPAVVPMLDVSAHEIEADSAWTHADPLGFPVTGKGMRIADIDTGIDVFHPSFFRADGDTLDWLDLNSNGVFDSGYDAVDINGNGSMDVGELLRFYDGRIYDPAGVFGSNYDWVYQPCWDWLYADQNYTGQREYGRKYGFTENDPTFGEPFYAPLDANGNGALDPGEKLVALGTSKIYATMNADSIERVRGVDLIDSDEDTNGHGTSVCGILAGGWPGISRFTGIAPDAEILSGYYFSGIPVSYLVPWARSRGADVMLYEFGGFIWEFLDGSSLEEEIISIENKTISQITPSGNLGRGHKHALATVPAGGSVTLNITVPSVNGSQVMYFYGSTLWRTDEGDLNFRLKSPHGSTVTLDGSTWYVDNYYLWYDRDTSSRGTCKFDLYVDRNTNSNAQGLWYLTVDNGSDAPIEIVGNISDPLSSWAGGAEFLNYYSDQKNVTFPATSDSSIVDGSYSTRGFEGYGGAGGGSISIGEISAFSGRGERIDGRHLLDICSPGNYDVYSMRTHQDGTGYPAGSYRQFSGTSAAGPHAAAAAALVRQVFPGASTGDVEYLLTSHALEDGFTGTVYNDTWGYGKLRILGAIGVATAVEEMAMGARPAALLLECNYPNPFNPSTWIPFYIPSDGTASLKIYDTRGALVKVLRDRWYEKGAHSVTWDGRDSSGRSVVSGVYFCVLRQGDERQTRKMVLLR